MSAPELGIGVGEVKPERDGAIDFREFLAWWTEQ
jgi:hypothetical protein